MCTTKMRQHNATTPETVSDKSESVRGTIQPWSEFRRDAVNPPLTPGVRLQSR